ncbi:hypothetical protein KC336_g20662, partial [Hortaea werneckii]
LGLFDVNIPLLYGEREKAFMRLQEEIIRRSNDQSIFAWGYDMAVDENPGALLARSPSDFRGSSNIIFREPDSFGKALQLDNQALRGSFVVRYEGDGLWTAKLNCEDIKGRRIKLSIVPRDSIISHGSFFQKRTLRSLGDRSIVAVARSGHGFCSRISPTRAMPLPTSRPVDAWQTVDKEKKVAGEIVKLRIVTSRANEDFYGGPLRLYVCPFKKHDRGLLKVLSVVPPGSILDTTDLEHDSSLRPVVTRFTYNDAAALLVHVKNLNETLELTCTAELARRRERDGEYVCVGSLFVKKHSHSWQENSWSHQAWQNYDLHRAHRFSGAAAKLTLTLKDGWKFSTRMTVVGSTEPEIQLEFETLPPPTSRIGKVGGLKRLVDREDSKVQFEAS